MYTCDALCYCSLNNFIGFLTSIFYIDRSYFICGNCWIVNEYFNSTIFCSRRDFGSKFCCTILTEINTADLCPVSCIDLIKNHGTCIIWFKRFYTSTIRCSGCVDLLIRFEILDLRSSFIRWLNLNLIGFFVYFNFIYMQASVILGGVIQHIFKSCGVIQYVLMIFERKHVMMIVIGFAIDRTWVFQNCPQIFQVICTFLCIRIKCDVHRICGDIASDLSRTSKFIVPWYVKVRTVGVIIFTMELIDLTVFKQIIWIHLLWGSIDQNFSCSLFKCNLCHTCGLWMSFVCTYSTAKVHIGVSFVIHKYCRVKAPDYILTSRCWLVKQHNSQIIFPWTSGGITLYISYSTTIGIEKIKFIFTVAVAVDLQSGRRPCFLSPSTFYFSVLIFFEVGQILIVHKTFVGPVDHIGSRHNSERMVVVSIMRHLTIGVIYTFCRSIDI